MPEVDFDELPSRIATVWGTRTQSFKKFHSHILDEADADGKGLKTGIEMHDLEEGEDVRLRAAPMARKRELLKRYQARHETYRKSGLKFVDFKTLKRVTNNVLYPPLMKANFIENILKKIEGKFGFTVLSYFHFILWLFAVNLCLSVLILVFIVIPHSAMAPQDFLDTCKGAVTNYTREACEMTRDYVDKISTNHVTSSTQQFIDFIQGTGWMEMTPMFYGSYFIKEPASPRYNMAVAFLLVTGAYFFLFLVLTVAYSSSSIKQRMLTYRKVVNFSPSHVAAPSLSGTLFTGWDFAVTDRAQASYRHRLITKLIMENYYEILKSRRKETPTVWDRLRLLLVRIGVNLLVLVLICISLAAIVASSVAQPTLLARENVRNNDALKFLCAFLPSISVVFFKFTMPPLFRVLTRLERYSPETQMNLVLLRSVLINLVSVYTLVITVGIRLICGRKQPCIEEVPCWETYIGQQMYRLSLIDFVVDIVSTVLDFVRRKVTDIFPQNKYLAFFALDAFDVPKGIIDAVYKQTVCWLGIFVAPMLTFVTTIKFLLLFGLRALTVLVSYKPPGMGKEGARRSFESRYFFAVVLLLSLFVSSGLNAFAIGRILPSQSCGPFRIFTKEDHFAYTSAIDVVSLMANPAQTFIWFLGTWIFFIIVMVLLSLCLLYYLSLASGNKKFANSLEAQLVSMKSMNLQYRKEILALRQRLGKQE